MKGKSLDQLGELQRQVLEIIWELGRATVHQVRDQLAEDRNLAYTTILTTMQKLEKAGLLTHERRGKIYVYQPTQSRANVGAKSG